MDAVDETFKRATAYPRLSPPIFRSGVIMLIKSEPQPEGIFEIYRPKTRPSPASHSSEKSISQSTDMQAFCSSDSSARFSCDLRAPNSDPRKSIEDQTTRTEIHTNLSECNQDSQISTANSGQHEQSQSNRCEIRQDPRALYSAGNWHSKTFASAGIMGSGNTSNDSEPASSEHLSKNSLPSSPTYVREKSPFASWASPTFSYESPPYNPPEIEAETSFGSSSPTYNPQPQKQRFNLQKNEANVAADTGMSFAERMLRKQGWTPGQGLGRLNQGRVDSVTVTEKRDKAGLGSEVDPRTRIEMGKHTRGDRCDEVWDQDDREVKVKWFETGEMRAWPSKEELLQGVETQEVKMCDCLDDFEASPTADYDMLATIPIAVKLKVGRVSRAFHRCDRVTRITIGL